MRAVFFRGGRFVSPGTAMPLYNEHLIKMFSCSLLWNVKTWNSKKRFSFVIRCYEIWIYQAHSGKLQRKRIYHQNIIKLQVNSWFSQIVYEMFWHQFRCNQLLIYCYDWSIFSTPFEMQTWHFVDCNRNFESKYYEKKVKAAYT